MFRGSSDPGRCMTRLRSHWAAPVVALVVLLLLSNLGATVLPGPGVPSSTGGRSPSFEGLPPLRASPADGHAAPAAVASPSLAATVPGLAPGWRLVSALGQIPLYRQDAAMAYDPAVGRVVLFGGYDGAGYLNDTYEFQGAGSSGSWTLLHPSAAPSPRASAAMAYDPALGEIVLFGGLNDHGIQDTTWVFDGTTWSELSGTQPGGRYGAAIAFDPSSGDLVLFGGQGSHNLLSETWTFGPNGWSALSPPERPPARFEASFAYDPARGFDILSGGMGSTGPLNDTWSFSNGAWAPLLGVGPAPAAVDAASVYDEADGVLLVASGNGSAGLLNETVELPSTGPWTSPMIFGSLPGRLGAAVTFDESAGEVVLFGGFNQSEESDTWVFSLDTSPLTWRLFNLSTAPPALTGASMTYDPVDGYVVLFGGEPSVGAGVLAQTWVFRHGTWSQLSPSISPPARRQAAMVYDARDGYVVMFGGSVDAGPNQVTYLADTWAFRDGSWTNLTTSLAPPPRTEAGIAYDAADGYVVLFGGHNGTSDASSWSYLNDTWRFEAGQWHELHPIEAPRTLAAPQMEFDPTSGYVVLFGGFHGNLSLAKGGSSSPVPMSITWKFLAAHWTNISGSLKGVEPSARYGGTLAYDPSVGALVLLGGSASHGHQPRDNNWTFSEGVWTSDCPICNLSTHAQDRAAFDAADDGVLVYGNLSGPNNTNLTRTCLNLAALNVSLLARPNPTDLDKPVIVRASVAGGLQPLEGVLQFDDGTNVSGDYASHTFTTLGDHLVTFTVNDSLGNATSSVATIVVHAPPIAFLEVAPWGPGNRTANFTATVVGGAPPYLYSFSFGPGSPVINTTVAANHTFALHTFPTNGSFNGSVTVIDSFGFPASATSQNVTIPAVLPTVSLSAASPELAVTAKFYVNAHVADPHGNDSFHWSKNTQNGTNRSSSNIPSSIDAANVTVFHPSLVIVYVNVTDEDNFTATASLNLTALPALAVAMTAKVPNTLPCPSRANDTPVELNASASGGSGGYQYQWSVGAVALNGANTTAYLTPGTTTIVYLRAVDSVGDSANASNRVSVPPSSCLPSSTLSTKQLLEIAAIGALGVIIVVEVVVLVRRRRSPPPAGPPREVSGEGPTAGEGPAPTASPPSAPPGGAT